MHNILLLIILLLFIFNLLLFSKVLVYGHHASLVLALEIIILLGYPLHLIYVRTHLCYYYCTCTSPLPDEEVSKKISYCVDCWRSLDHGAGQ